MPNRSSQKLTRKTSIRLITPKPSPQAFSPFNMNALYKKMDALDEKLDRVIEKQDILREIIMEAVMGKMYDLLDLLNYNDDKIN